MPSRTLLLLALVASIVTQPLLGAGTPVAGPEFQSFTLENGLRMYVLERPASPTFAAVYQFGVGAASDPKGRTGIAHLLEHMMFKGTETMGTLDPAKEKAIVEKLSALWRDLHAELDKADDPFRKPDEEKVKALRAEIEKLSAEQKPLIVKNEYDDLMSRAGAVSLNAGTSYDTTSYMVQLPANRLELWFRMESDRLLHPVFREFYSERDVIYEERRQTTENYAEGQASEVLAGLLFQAHPYGNPIVGWPRDIERLQMGDALDYFRTYYSPSNCILAIAGDVKAAEVERLARKYLSQWKRQELPPLLITSEPPAKGEKRAVVEFDAQPALSIAWLTVPSGHPDQYALTILASILGGLETSRMDRTIVQEERIATGVSAWHGAMRYGGRFGLQGQIAEGHTASELEAAMDREIGKIQKDGVTAEELERAKIGTEVRRVRQLKSNFGQVFQAINAVWLSGGTGYIQEYERRINAVTAAEVQEAAKKYLVPTGKVLVETRKVAGATASGRGSKDALQHKGGPSGERAAKHSAGFAEASEMMRKAPPITIRVPEIGKDVDRVELPCGTVVFLQEDHSAPSVDIGFTWLGGSNTTPVEKLAPFSLASQLWDEGGTASLDPMAFAARKEALGMSLGAGFGGTTSNATFWSLSRNFRDSFDLALDLFTKPRFDADRLVTIQKQYIDQQRRRFDYPQWGVSAIRDHVMDGDHPRLGYEPSRKEIEAVTPEDVRAIWKRYIGSDNLRVTAVGDFQKPEMLSLLTEKLCALPKAGDKERVWITRDPVVRPGVYVVEKDVSSPAISIFQHLAADRTVPEADHAALDILNDILGGSGFRSRLMERLRSDEGLTYGIYSGVGHEGRPGVPGSFSASYVTNKDAVARSIKSAFEEIRKIVREEVSPAEVEEQKEGFRNRFVFQFTNPFYSVQRLMVHELDDRPYDRDKRVLDAIEKVTVADVKRVAAKYLKPENLGIFLFGTPSPEERAALDKDFTVKVLPKEEVFKGGYFDEVKPAATPGMGVAPPRPAKPPKPGAKQEKPAA